MNKEACSEYASKRAKIDIKKIHLANGRNIWRRRRWSHDIIFCIGESIESIGKVKEQDHEDEEHSEGVDFNEEREIPLEEDEEKDHWNTNTDISKREAVESNRVDIRLSFRLLRKINDTLNTRVKGLGKQFIVS